MRHLSLVFVVACSLLFSGWLVADEQVSEQQLAALKRDINKLQNWLDKAKGEHSSLESSLKTTEVQIGNLVKQIAANTQEASQLEERLQRLKQEQTKLQQQLDQQATYLSKQIRSAYTMGRQEYLKVLLNQQQPDRVARLLRYYDFINKKRTQQIESYLATAKQLSLVQSEIINRSQELQQVRVVLQQKRSELIAEQKNRQQVISRLSKEIAGKGTELSKLQADQKRLEQLLVAVTEALVRLPAPKDARPFAQMRGQLPWPLQGRILSAFGSKQFNNRITSRGLLIQAKEGEYVRAVHGGRVVFADWMRNFGFVMILDHGDSFLSLYGHNQALNQELGDWVHGGEVIATAGSSGGQPRAGLYFEIRKQGKPLDPIGWVAKR